MRRIARSVATFLPLAIASAGGGGGCSGVRGPFLPPVPASPRDGEKPIPGGARAFAIQNDRGQVSVGPSRTDAGRVRYRIRAGAHTAAEAERIAGSSDVLLEPGEERTRILVVGPPLPGGGSLRVDLEVDLPAGIESLSVQAAGDILGNGLPPDSRLDARDGKVQVFGAAGRLAVSTVASPIQIEGVPAEIDLRSTRGNITLWMTGAGPLSGRIESHSGLVQLRVQGEVSTNLRAMTQVGRVTCDLPLERKEAGERFLRAAIGGGGGELEIVSYRGDIQILRPSP